VCAGEAVLLIATGRGRDLHVNRVLFVGSTGVKLNALRRPFVPFGPWIQYHIIKTECLPK